MTTHKPPIKCSPCRVNINGNRYRVLSDGRVAKLQVPQVKPTDVKELLQWELENLQWNDAHSDIARAVRQEASRIRRNRNARERNQAKRDIGLGE